MFEFKVRIILDAEKVKVCPYEKAAIWETINNIASEYEIKETKGGVYVGTGTDRDFALFGGFTLALKTQSWFLPLVARWTLYSTEGENDLLAHYQNTERRF